MVPTISTHLDTVIQMHTKHPLHSRTLVLLRYRSHLRTAFPAANNIVLLQTEENKDNSTEKEKNNSG